MLCLLQSQWKEHLGNKFELFIQYIKHNPKYEFIVACDRLATVKTIWLKTIAFQATNLSVILEEVMNTNCVRLKPVRWEEAMQSSRRICTLHGHSKTRGDNVLH